MEVANRKVEDIVQGLPEGLREEFVKKLETAKAELKEPRDEGENGWKVLTTKLDFTVYNKPDKVWVTQRSESDINLPLARVVPYLQDISFRKSYDNLLDAVEVKQDHKEQNWQVIRSQIKGKFMIISPRDFITYRVFGYISEDLYFEIYFTPENPELRKLDQKSNPVRAFVELQAMFLKKTGDNTCRLLMYSKVDPQISMVPQALVMLGSKESGFVPRYFTKQVEKADKAKGK